MTVRELIECPGDTREWSIPGHPAPLGHETLSPVPCCQLNDSSSEYMRAPSTYAPCYLLVEQQG